MDKLGVGMVGYGFMGKVHTYGYQNLPLFYDPPPVATELVGVCTAHDETGQKAVREAGYQFATTDYRELLDRPDVHIINCCLPNHLHRDLLIDAIQAGKHVYCDKPLAMNLAEAEEIAEAARQGSRKYQMTLQYRFLPATLRAKQLVADGFLGRVFHFRAMYLHAGYVDATRPMSWRLDKTKGGGGALADLGSHIIDLMRHLLGEFQEVFASCETFVKERPVSKEAGASLAPVEVDDLAILHVKTQSGAVGTIEASRFATGTNDELRFEIHGEKGAMKFNLMDPNWLTVYDCRDAEGPYGGDRGFKQIETVQRYPAPAVLPAPKLSVGWIRAHLHCLYDFLTHVAGDRPTCPSFEDGLAVQRIMEVAYRSSESRSWLTL